MKRVLIFLLACSFHTASASIFDFKLWQADSKLNKEKYSAAINDYLKIQAKDPNNQRLNYNLGIGLYRKGNYENAQFNFMQAAKSAKEPILKEKAFYNLGNSFFQQEDYKSAINAYEEALKIDPKDEDAEFNLELAKKKLQEKDQKDQENKDQKDEQNQDQDKKDKENQNKDQKQKDSQEKNKENQNKDQKQKDSQEKDNSDQKQKNQGDQKQKAKKKKSDLGEQEAKMLLMQVKEGKPEGGALGVKSKSTPDPKVREKPW